jgi:uncharacterized membrane protein YfcA
VGFAQYAPLFVIVLAASLIHGSAGFGFSVIAIPLLSFILPVRMTVAITVFFILGYTFLIAFRFRKLIPWRMILIPLIVSVFGRAFGVFLLMNLDTAIIRLVWGVVLVLLSVYFVSISRKTRIESSSVRTTQVEPTLVEPTLAGPTLFGGIIAGLLSGIFGGMFNTGGPPLVVYFYSAFPDNRRYSAALQVTFFLGALASLVVHLAYGNITFQVLRFVGVGMTGVLLGTFVGVQILERLARKHLSILVYSLMALMGIIQIVKAI